LLHAPHEVREVGFELRARSAEAVEVADAVDVDGHAAESTGWTLGRRVAAPGPCGKRHIARAGDQAAVVEARKLEMLVGVLDPFEAERADGLFSPNKFAVLGDDRPLVGLELKIRKERR